MAGEMNVGDIVEKYIALRDKRDAIMREAKEKCAKIDEHLEKIEGKVMGVLDGLGLESVRTEAGTAYVAERTSATVADWDAVLDHIKQNGLWHMLEKRVNKKAVDEYKSEQNDLPPGVNYRVVRMLNVRRSS